MISLFHVFLLKVRLAWESLLKKSKNVTKKCMLKKSERCINFFVCRNWYMQIAFLVCVDAAHLLFSLFLCSRYRLFLLKWCGAASHLPFPCFRCSRYRVFFPKRCVAARCMVFSHYSCMRYMLFGQKWCVAALHLCFFQLLSATAHGFAAEMVCRWRCVGEGVSVRVWWCEG